MKGTFYASKGAILMLMLVLSLALSATGKDV
jgi:hypothetical protein